MNTIEEGSMSMEQGDAQQAMIAQFEQMRQMYPLEITFDEDKQKELVELVLRDFSVAEDARKKKAGSDLSQQSWEEKMAEIIGTWEGVRKPKTKPFKGCSNKTMRLTTSIEQTVHSMVLQAVWKDGQVNFRPGVPSEIDRVKRTNKFMEWVVRIQLKLYGTVDNFVHQCTKMGTGVYKYSWNVSQKYLPRRIPTPDGVVVDFIPVDDSKADVIVVPIEAMYFQPGATTIQGIQPIIHRIPLTYFELQQGTASGNFLDKAEALTQSANNVLSADLGPIAKIEEDVSLKAKYVARMRNFPQDILEWYGKLDVGDPRGPQEVIIWVEKKSRTYLSGKLLRSLYKRNRRPFISSPCIRRGDDILGIGYVELSKPLSDEIDALYNQSTDSNTLDIMPSGFYSPTSGFDPDKVELGPNVWLPVENPVQNVYMPVRSHNTEKFVMMIRNVLEFVERLTAASSYMMGKESELIGGTGSATRANYIMQQGEVRMGPILRRIAGATSELITELYYMYWQSAPMGFAERIVGQDGTPLFPNMELRENFLEEGDVYNSPDITQSSKQVQEMLAEQVFTMFSTHPLVMTNIQRLWQVAYDFLDKKGHQDPESIVGPKPGSNLDMQVINVENTRMLQGELMPINPTDIDVQHIPGHAQMLQTNPGIAPEIHQIIATHINMHQERLGKMVGQPMMRPGEKNEQGAEGKKVA